MYIIIIYSTYMYYVNNTSAPRTLAHTLHIEHKSEHYINIKDTCVYVEESKTWNFEKWEINL